jgi:hypothetical protein
MMKKMGRAGFEERDEDYMSRVKTGSILRSASYDDRHEVGAFD